MPPEINLFNSLMSVLMVVFGFLLNRVFTEIDKLRTTDADLVTAINVLRVSLPSGYIDKVDFHRHEMEERAMNAEMRSDMKVHFDKEESMIVAMHKRLDRTP